MDKNTPIFSLRETVEQFCIRRGNTILKHFPRYFSIAGDIYREIYTKILPSVINKYVEVQPKDAVNPYPYIYTPQGVTRFFGVWITNQYGRLVQVFYNDKLNVITKPSKKKVCGCQQTDLCDCVSNLQVVITPKIIDGVTYYIKAWVECCGNGDVLQYTETPVKKYGTEGGSYSFEDYGDDYDIINDGGNIVYIKQTKNLGRLATKDCGCPVESVENTTLIFDTCSCYLPQLTSCCKRYNENNFECVGSIKFSECGDKIYLENVKSDDGFVIASYQTDGVTCGEEIFVPEYARRTIWAGIEQDTTIFFPRSTPTDKREAERRYLRAKTDLFEFINPLHGEFLFNSITAEIKF